MSLKPAYKPHIIVMMVCYRTMSERFIIIIFWSIFFKKVKIDNFSYMLTITHLIYSLISDFSIELITDCDSIDEFNDMLILFT